MNKSRVEDHHNQSYHPIKRMPDILYEVSLADETDINTYEMLQSHHAQ